jgi:hypothetical protein
MELEELKYLFLQQNTAAKKKSSADSIAAMLKRRSAAPTGRLKRNLLAELVMAILFCALPMYVLFSHPGFYIKGLALVFFLIAAFFVVKIIRLRKAIRRYEAASYAIKQRLKLLIDILNRSARLYVQSTIIAFPLLFGMAALLVQLDNQHKDSLLFLETPRAALIVYFISASVWCTAMYFFTKWYVKELYGQHIKQLQSHLNEMA